MGLNDAFLNNLRSFLNESSRLVASQKDIGDISVEMTKGHHFKTNRTVLFTSQTFSEAKMRGYSWEYGI